MSPSDPSPDASLRDLRALLALEAIPGLGPRRIRDLLQRHGAPVAALRASVATAMPPAGVRSAFPDDVERSQAIARAVEREHAPERHPRIDRELDRAREHGVRLLGWGRPGYPAALADLPGAPAVLRVRGRLPDDAVHDPVPRRSIAIVGSRDCSDRAERTAHELGHRLAARGVTVVSGLALGVDAAAHRGALAAHGEAPARAAGTVAVLGSGVLRVAPTRHARLAQAIVDGGGAVISEFPVDAAAHPGHFPRRNRLISAMAAAVIVVEAGERSGVFHTVDRALEQGRAVFVVPDHPTNPRARGGLELLRDGAAPLLAVDDLFGAGGPFEGVQEPIGAASVPVASADPLDERLLDALAAHGPCAADALAAALARAPRDRERPIPALDPAGLALRLSRLEIEGRVTRTAGGTYAVVERLR